VAASPSEVVSTCLRPCLPDRLRVRTRGTMAERIVSRQADEQALVDFLDSALSVPSALVIVGDAGIGKTTLWLDALRRARERGFRLLTSRAAAAESVLAYTALADLLGDVDDSIWAQLPVPQRRGLDAALLRQRDGRDTDARAVAAAFLAVIDQLAAQGPVVVAIDDLQWLDTSSANVVSFAARRLPVGAMLLCTTRSEDAASRLQLPTPDAVRRIRVQPLTVGELHQVLMFRLGGSVTRPTLLRIHEISGGNPFYALELAREIGTRQPNNELGLPGSFGELVRTMIGRVGSDAEGALLAMASLPDPTVQLVAQATDLAPDRLVELLDEAEGHAIVAIDGNRVHFTHPVLAHGVYSGAWPNSSLNPNYGRVTSPCPTASAGRKHWNPLTRLPTSHVAGVHPLPPRNCLNWQSVWAEKPPSAGSVVRHSTSTPETPRAPAPYSNGPSKGLRRRSCGQKRCDCSVCGACSTAVPATRPTCLSVPSQMPAITSRCG
jgi:hypothetical protein